MPEYKKRITIGYEINPRTGKPKQIRKRIKIEAKNPREADRLAILMTEELRRNHISDPTKMTFKQLTEKYYEVKNTLKPKTISGDRVYMNKLLLAFGKHKVIKITADDILHFLQGIEDFVDDEWTLHNYYKTMNKYMNFALAQDIISKNPVRMLKDTCYAKLPEPKLDPEAEALVKDFITRVFADTEPLPLKIRAMLLLTLDGCLRPCELLALKWNNLSWEDSRIKVEENLYCITKKEAERQGIPYIGFTTPKTRGSKRIIPLSKVTMDTLREYKAECDTYFANNRLSNTSNVLFFQKQGRVRDNSTDSSCQTDGDAPLVDVIPCTQSVFVTAIKRKCAELEMQSFAPYKLRKFAYTLRYNGDFTEQYCNYILGHSVRAVDATYILSNHGLCTGQHPKWERILHELVGYETEEAA